MLKAESPEQTEIHNAWYHNKAEEIQQYTDSHNSKRFYDALKTVYGPQTADSGEMSLTL